MKATTIRVILALATMNNWPLRQLDVSNAFLYGTLEEVFYMVLPQGYVHPQYPHHVCKLHKSIYGLKQASRAWLSRLTTFLLSLNFIVSKADTSLFILKHGADVVFLLVYVDDLVLTGSSPVLL